MIVPSEFSQTIFQQSHHGNAWQMLPHFKSASVAGNAASFDLAQVSENVQVMVSELVK